MSVATMLLLVVQACGGGPPSDELLSARRAYKQAERSNAKKLVPDKLLTARQALESAEEAHEDDAGSMEERTRAYIAERKALLAVTLADIRAAKEAEAKAKRRYTEELEQRQATTSRELRDTRDRLGKTKEELERERRAREAAEERAAAAIASLEEIAKVKEEKRGVVITLQGAVLFQTGKAVLLPIARQQLDKVAEALLDQDETKRIVIEGHTDSRGSERANRELSQERAESVRTFLIERGVEPDRVVAIGKGEDEPIASNRTSEGRANNRRVEIIISD